MTLTNYNAIAVELQDIGTNQYLLINKDAITLYKAFNYTLEGVDYYTIFLNDGNTHSNYEIETYPASEFDAAYDAVAVIIFGLPG